MSDPTLVVIFLRGGADALNIVSPTSDVDYLAARTGPRPYWDDPITQSDTLSA